MSAPPTREAVEAAVERLRDGIKAAVEWSASFPLSLSADGVALGPDRYAAESVYEQTRSLDLDLATLMAALEAVREEIVAVRDWRWMNHGCSPAGLYGDDGEMQCGQCGRDFKRDPIRALLGAPR